MSILNSARFRINAADEQIIHLLPAFQFAAQPVNHDALNVSSELKSLLNAKSVPEELWANLVGFIQPRTLRINGETHEEVELAQCLLDRYLAVSDIALHKLKNPDRWTDDNGVYDAYDAPRHNDVIEKNVKAAVDNGADEDLARAFYVTLLDYFVQIQNDYLNNSSGPIVDTNADAKRELAHAL